jgi:hypothetical protein
MAIDEKDKSGIEIISAHKNGASKLIQEYCKSHNLSHKHFKIDDYLVFGPNAEKIRISSMLNYALENNGVIFAFWDGCSPSTEYAIQMALNRRMDGYIMNFTDMTFTDLLSLHDMQKRKESVI